MRRLLTGLTLICVMTVLLPASSTSAQEGSQPSILIEEMRHDMGEVFERDFYKHTFTFKNVGEADLHVKSVKPG
jgi:hypothetical protein